MFCYSAGVGRTGVFIAVETACCLIEAGVPLSPEEMLDTLRCQRPSLIQTPVRQYFVYYVCIELLLEKFKEFIF